VFCCFMCRTGVDRASTDKHCYLHPGIWVGTLRSCEKMEGDALQSYTGSSQNANSWATNAMIPDCSLRRQYAPVEYGLHTAGPFPGQIYYHGLTTSQMEDLQGSQWCGGVWPATASYGGPSAIQFPGLTWNGSTVPAVRDGVLDGAMLNRHPAWQGESWSAAVTSHRSRFLSSNPAGKLFPT